MKIYLVDDHQIFRQSLKLLMSFEEDMEVVGEASDGVGLIEGLKTTTPDVVLMDMSMGRMGGLETSKFVKNAYPEIKILILSMNADSLGIVSALEAGVNGYLLKSAGKDEVLMAIRAVNQGSSYFSSEVSAVIIKQLSNPSKPKKSKADNELSEREIEVLTLIATQHSSSEIAAKLFISPRTVDAHRRNLLAKLDVKNTAGLVRYALENKLV